MSAQVRVLLESILESVELIERYVKDVTRESFFTSQQMQDAVLRRIEIIGEAVKSLPQEWKDAHAVAPWREMEA
ncbi:MAG: HepT-like ribonuclease domain-containing protein [Ktedonobacterales bacterium]